MTMETSNCVVSAPHVNNSANDAWRKSTLEMVNIISKNARPPLIKDYNNLLLENTDLKKQYKMAMAALDSIITGKNGEKIKSNPERKEVNILKSVNNNEKEKDIEMLEGTRTIMIDNEKEKDIETRRGARAVSVKTLEQVKEQMPNVNSEFKTIKKKFDALSVESKISLISSKKCVKKDTEFMCTSCLKLKPASSLLSKDVKTMKEKYIESDTLVDLQDYDKLKKQLQEVQDDNVNLKTKLRNTEMENCELRDQIHSLELSLKTMTEAINLQDEQLNEYGSVVTSLKQSRSAIIEKMKEANAKNSYNIMIMANIDQEVEQLRRQLDAYNELLNTQNIQQIDKASGTEELTDEQQSQMEIMRKKDNYITLLQDRLCEAIVDLRNKDSEIKNHANSIKGLINNYESEKNCLENRLKSVNNSAEKLEVHKVKQQETLKQLMKLIEFLQQKLEKINKK